MRARLRYSTRRRRVIQGIAGSLAAAVPMARLFAMARKPGVQGLHEISGDVRINEAGVAQGAPVLPGDAVETGANGRAIYVVGRSVFLQRENTRVELAGPPVDPGDDEPNPVIHLLRVLTGKLLSVHARGELSVETENGSIGIRGTGLYVDVQPNRTYACVCYGTADLVDPQGQPLETVRTTHHESPRYLYPQGAPIRIEQAPVVDHTDDELILLESLVGRRPPFLSLGRDRNY